MRARDPGPPRALPWDVSKVKSYHGPDGDILLGDVKEALSRAESKQWDFRGAIIDPPYNIGMHFREGGTDNVPLSEYSASLREVVGRALDIVGNGRMVLTYGYPEILAHLARRFPLDKQKWLQWFRYDGYLNPHSKLWTRTHESILCVWRGDRPEIASMDALRVPYSPGYLERAGGPMGRKGNFRRGDSPNTNPGPRIARPDERGRIPGDVLYVPTVRRTARKERWFVCETHNKLCPPELAAEHDSCARIKHPTQKPLALCRHLVLAITRPGKGAILVPYVGSGSECVAAKMAGVRFMGAEKDPLYLGLAAARLRRIGE